MTQNASLIKRLAASLYELLSLIAIWLLCTFVFVMFSGDVDTAIERFSLQAILWIVTGIYFVVCWIATGQTLATQAWKIKLVNTDNKLLSIQQALFRYVLANVSLFVFGLGFLWAVVDKEHLFLHDRVLNTRLIKLNKN
jgi:uncharacterized RDD family membrane protein YckC